MQHHRSAALLACALILALAGCGSSTLPSTTTGGRHDSPPPPPAKALTIFTDLSVEGPTGATGASSSNRASPTAHASRSIVGVTARLRPEGPPRQLPHLPRADGRRQPRHRLVEPGDDAANAQRAASTKDAVAYIGDFESAATALSLPALSPAGSSRSAPGAPTSASPTQTPPTEGRPAALLPAERAEQLRARHPLRPQRGERDPRLHDRRRRHAPLRPR